MSLRRYLRRHCGSDFRTVTYCHDACVESLAIHLVKAFKCQAGIWQELFPKGHGTDVCVRKISTSRGLEVSVFHDRWVTLKSGQALSRFRFQNEEDLETRCVTFGNDHLQDNDVERWMKSYPGSLVRTYHFHEFDRSGFCIRLALLATSLVLYVFGHEYEQPRWFPEDSERSDEASQ